MLQLLLQARLQRMLLQLLLLLLQLLLGLPLHVAVLDRHLSLPPYGPRSQGP